MAGFTAVISDSKVVLARVGFREKDLYGHESGYTTRIIRSEKFVVEQFTNEKFAAEKVFEEDAEYIIGIEGVLLNSKQLKTKQQTASLFETIKSLYIQYDSGFLKHLRGDYSGFIFSKKNDKWLIFGNPVGSKKMFYFRDDSTFIFSSELKSISHILGTLNHSKNINKTAAYLLLTYGYMVENETIVDGVKSVVPGTSVTFENGKITTEEYFHLRNIPQTTDDKETIIEKIDHLFSEAVRLEFEKDKEYGYKHIATLSGGLDSRMTVLVANKLGYTEQLNFTFSQSDYLDEKIAKKIASDYGHEFMFQSLDNGNYLKVIDKVVFYNDGLVSYAGAAHVLSMVETMNFSLFGLIHTGQVGDAVLGSFLSQPSKIAPKIDSGAYSTKKIDRIAPFLTEKIKKFESEELYKFYNRGFLGALNGNIYLDLFSQTASPFLEQDFLSYCYSIPESVKYKQQIYLDWIEKKHKEFADYPWEKTGVSPLKSLNYKRFIDLNYYRRMSLKFFDKKSGRMHSGMNPFDRWLESNVELKRAIDNYFSSHIHLIDNDLELQKDCLDLFYTGSTGEKMQVLTLLAAVKLHNLQA